MRSRSKIWGYFTLIIFFVSISTLVIMSGIALLLYRTGHLTNGRNGLVVMIFLLCVSAILGTVMSGGVARSVLKPLTELTAASKEVAKGNFDIQLEEKSPIPEIQELGHNFNVMTRELSSIETLRNDFVMNVSHEFRTPLSSIEGYATLLQDATLSDEEREEYAQMIIDSSKQLATLAGNILTLSRLEDQHIAPEKKSYRLDEQIRQVIVLLEAQWGPKGIDLQVDLPRTTYYGCEDLLPQVWMNLISNAIKFTGHSGCVSVSLVADANSVRVIVSDTGCGMDEETVRHAFDKFYQGDTSRKSEGNGLGLALAKQIVDLCEGDIAVTSEVGVGSTFTVSLPTSTQESMSQHLTY